MHTTVQKKDSNTAKKSQPFFSPSFIQPKLTIGAPNDKYEQEADSMADKVMRMQQDTRSIQTKPLRISSQSVKTIQTMAACPNHLDSSDPVPSGWKAYHGNSSVFHCGFRGILEDRTASPEDPQNECFYDDSGNLVDENHPYAGCRGTPNDYDSSSNWWDHTFNDRGGIRHRGWEAFWESRRHSAHEVNSKCPRRFPDGTIIDCEGRMHLGPGPKY